MGRVPRFRAQNLGRLGGAPGGSRAGKVTGGAKGIMATETKTVAHIRQGRGLLPLFARLCYNRRGLVGHALDKIISPPPPKL